MQALKDEAAQQVEILAEHQIKLTQITAEKDLLHQNLADLTRQRDDILDQYQQVHRDYIEQCQRQQLLEEELSKAEAKIVQQANIVAEHQNNLGQIANERGHLQQSVDDLTRQRDDLLNQNQKLQRENIEQGQR